jgi:type II secretory pathway pseudopilin PulG
VDRVPPPLPAPHSVRGRLRALQDERGFTLLETLLAGLILIILAAGIAGVLTSSIAATSVARDRTGAEQCAADQVEQIRRRAYDDVGTIGGNPPGTVPATSACGSGFAATANVAIAYRNDPTPTSYATAANYKKVTVIVKRDRDGKTLATVVTYVSPTSRAPFGGINNAIVNVTVIDLGTNLAYPGATVTLANGPSPSRSDTTDASGQVSFPALTPNPTSGPTAYYDLTVSGGSGYQTLAADLPPGGPNPPAGAAHVQLSPSQTSATAIRIFKPAEIDLVLQKADGSAYSGGASVKIDSSFTGATTSDSVASGSSSKAITSLAGAPVIPGATYTVVGRTTAGLCAFPASSPVPSSGYPGNVKETFTLTFTPCPSGTLAVKVTQLGADAAGAAVTVSGGPNNVSVSGTTDASGNVSFTLPAGSGYSIAASKTGQSASAAATVTQGATTNGAVALPDPPSGALVVDVHQVGVAASGAVVTVTGGPYSISQSLTTAATGQVTFASVPAGSGYAVTATKGSYTATASPSPTIAASATTSTTIDLPLPPVGSVKASVSWLGHIVPGAAVTISGGPFGISVVSSPLTTDVSGNLTFTNVPSGAGYLLHVTKNGEQSADYAVSVSTGATSNVAVAMPTATLTVTATWAGLAAGGAAVSVSGGPDSTGGPYGGTTNPITGIATISVPTTTSSPFTVTVTKNGGSGATSVTTVPAGGASATVAIGASKTITITVQQNGVAYSNKAVTVSVTGGPNGTAGAAPAYSTAPSPRTTTNANPATVTALVPAQAGYTYTVKVSVSPCANGALRTGTSTLTAAPSPPAANLAVTVNMTGTLACPYTP